MKVLQKSHKEISKNKEIKDSYRKAGIFIQLILGSNPKPRVVAARRPRQMNRRLQTVVHFLVDGASKLCAIISVITAQML